MIAFAAMFSLAASIGLYGDPTLAPGGSIEVEIRTDATEITTPAIAARIARFQLREPVRGTALELEAGTAGTYTVEARAFGFNAYLVVRDADGTVLAEDDDGWVGVQPRVVVDLEAGARCRVEIGAWRSRTGVAVVACRAGRTPASPPGATRAEADVAEAVACAEESERRFGDADRRSLFAWSLAGQTAIGAARYEDAERADRRALAIADRAGGDVDADRAAILHGTGISLWKRQRDAEGREWFLRELEIRERISGEDDRDVAQAVHNIGLTFEGEKNWGEAERWYRRGLSIRERVLGENDAETAWSAYNVGVALASQARLSEAAQFFGRAHAIRAVALGATASDTLIALATQGLALIRAGHDADTRDWLARASRLHDDAPQETLGRLRLASALGAVSLTLGSYPEAERWYRTALSAQHHGIDAQLELARAMLGVSSALTMQGRLSESEEWCRRALAAVESAPVRSPDDLAMTLHDLGVVLSRQRRYDDARKCIERSVSIRAEAFGRVDRWIARSFDVLSSIDLATRQLDRAQEDVDRSLEIRLALIGGRADELARSYAQRGELFALRGKLVEAEADFARAVEIEEQGNGPDHPFTAQWRRSLAEIQLRRGKTAEAGAGFERALAALERAFDRDSYEVAATMVGSLGAVLENAGPEAALARAEDALTRESTTMLREVSFAPADVRATRVTQFRTDLFRLLSLVIAPDAPCRLDDRVAGALYSMVSAWKGVCYRTGASTRDADTPAAEELRQRGRELSSELSRLAYTTVDIDPKERAEKFERLQEERRAVERKLCSVVGLRPEREHADAEELGRLLPEHSALVDLVVWNATSIRATVDARPDDDLGVPRVTAWITRAGAAAPIVVDLGRADELERRVGAALAELAPSLRGAPLPRATDTATPAPLAELSDALWRPLATHLKGVERLFVCPDGFLAEFPFEALEVGKGACLLEVADVVYAQDPVTLRELLAHPPASERRFASLLAVGGVDYGARAPANAKGRGNLLRQFEPLPETKLEVRGIADLMRSTAGAEPTVLLGADATEEAVKAAAPRHAVLHFATHGIYQREGITSIWAAAANANRRDAAAPVGIGGDLDPVETPALSGVSPGFLTGVILAGANAPEPEGRDDGILTAEEVERLDLAHCDLAVLSACETALGKGTPGEGLMSLRRAFLAAGARSVISTLWRVDDAATRALMGEFYRRALVEHESPSRALRAARLSLRDHAEWREPRYWAAFTLAGDWR